MYTVNEKHDEVLLLTCSSFIQRIDTVWATHPSVTESSYFADWLLSEYSCLRHLNDLIMASRTKLVIVATQICQRESWAVFPSSEKVEVLNLQRNSGLRWPQSTIRTNLSVKWWTREQQCWLCSLSHIKLPPLQSQCLMVLGFDGKDIRSVGRRHEQKVFWLTLWHARKHCVCLLTSGRGPWNR